VSEYCCWNFEKALQSGTDTEGWGAVITETDRGFYVGGLFNRPIIYCPWCGDRIEITNKSS